MKRILTVFLTFCLLCPGPQAGAGTSGDPVVVLEYFTTQICPDCRPADEILQKLAGENAPDIIIYGCHVTYLDNDLTKDKLSREFCDKRHIAYMSALTLGALYTPQLFINGRFNIYGDQEKYVRAGAAMGLEMKTVERLALAWQDGKIAFTLPETPLERPADIWLIAYDKMRPAQIQIEPETGEVFNHANAVAHIEKIMVWDGGAQNIAYLVTAAPADEYAVIVQYTTENGLLAAGKLARD